MPSKRRSTRPTKGYKSKTEIIARNEATRIVKRNIHRSLEDKRFDGQQIYTNMLNAGVIISMFTDPFGAATWGSGVTGQTSVGDKITPTQLLIRWGMSMQAIAANSINRVLVIQVHGTWAAPAMADIFQSVADTSMAHYNQASVGNGSGSRFRILYDKRFAMQVGDATVRSGIIRIPRKRMRRVSFAPGAPNAISDGNIFLLYCGDQAVNPVQFKYYSVLQYEDA